MDVAHYIEEVEKYIDTFRLQVEEEKKEIAESQKKFSNLVTSFSQKAPSSSVINSLFKDDEPDGFVFSKYEDKRKQLAEQRREEYNTFLEKKERDLFFKKRVNEEKRSATPKSILDSVDYEQILAKRKEEEAKFRTMNHSDVLHSTKPVLNENIRKPDLNILNRSEDMPSFSKNNINMAPVNLPGSVISAEEINNRFSIQEPKKNLEKEDVNLLEERIAKRLEEQRQQMILEFESALRKNNQVTEEIQKLRTSANSVRSPPQSRVNLRMEDFPKFSRTGGGGEPVRDSYGNLRMEEFPKFGRTGGGGEPVRDSYGNLITLRGAKTENDSEYKNMMSFPSMQQQPIRDRMTLYREELQRQIEEKKRLEALEKAKTREVEEKFSLRLEEQRLQMQKEYDEELKRNNKIKAEFQRQQERIRKLEEFQRKDAEERRRKMLEAKPPEPKPAAPEIVNERSQSPPIPAVRTKVLLEKAVPPVTATQTLTEVKPENVFSSLAEIRRQIRKEQEKPIKDTKKSYEVMNRRTVQEVYDDDDDDDDILKSSYQYTDFAAS